MCVLILPPSDIATYPNSEVCAEVGGELKITCVVNTIYNSVTSGTTMKWYKDTCEYNNQTAYQNSMI